jgi:hypothetical protein
MVRVTFTPEDADTAWCVPAIKDEQRIPVAGQVVVTRTRGGGKSSETLRAGLAQSHALRSRLTAGLAAPAADVCRSVRVSAELAPNIPAFSNLSRAMLRDRGRSRAGARRPRPSRETMRPG